MLHTQCCRTRDREPIKRSKMQSRSRPRYSMRPPRLPRGRCRFTKRCAGSDARAFSEAHASMAHAMMPLIATWLTAIGNLLPNPKSARGSGTMMRSLTRCAPLYRAPRLHLESGTRPDCRCNRAHRQLSVPSLLLGPQAVLVPFAKYRSLMALAGTLNEPLDHRAEGSVLQRHDRQSGARADIAGSPACVPGAIIQSVDAYVIKTSPIAMIPSDRI